MWFQTLLLAGLVSGQSMNLTQVLDANNKTLSTLSSLLSTLPSLTSNLTSLQHPITLLAPSNNAFSKYLSTADGITSSKDPAFVSALLQYHVLNGSFPSTAFGNNIQFLPTLLTNDSFMNVTGGQVVGVSKNGNGDAASVQVLSGEREMAKITVGDITFSNGILHVLDTVLTIPLPPSRSTLDSQLTSLYGALKSTSLLSTIDSLSDITLFAPSNAAFQNIGSAIPALSNGQLSDVLEYHVVNGSVGYSSLLGNETLKTVQGGNVGVEIVGGKVFVGQARVLVRDVIVANGVVHVIDGVLNPSNTTATPNPTAATQAVAFSGASSVSTIPFTSGVSATTTAPSASTMTAGAERAFGTMGLAALVGLGVLGGAF